MNSKTVGKGRSYLADGLGTYNLEYHVTIAADFSVREFNPSEF